MTDLRILRLDQAAEWSEVVRRADQADFHHLPSYHALAENQREGLAHLFCYRERQYFIALPLILRPFTGMRGLAAAGAGWWDATSVYGYAGPIASHAEIPADVLRTFQDALQATLRDLRVVTVFSRLHPLIPQAPLLAGLGELQPGGQTISIDLSLPLDAQYAQYRANHKRGIKQLQHLGVRCWLDQTGTGLQQFIDIYHETMRRVDASEAYFFDQRYFETCKALAEVEVQLFICAIDEAIICGGLFTLYNGIVQYHLGGTRDQFLQLAPTKLLFDTVRRWGVQRGARVFHLGGGVGGREDSLFHFKKGFSETRHPFTVWRWVLLPGVYEQLCQETAHWNDLNGLQIASPGYFPLYRAPVRELAHSTLI